MLFSFLLLVQPFDYCPHCGAALTGVTRSWYKTLARRALPWATGATFLVLGLLLLFIILLGGLGHAWEETRHGNDITFYNTTNSPLLADSTSEPMAPIPRGKSYWPFYPGDSGPLEVEVALFTPEGEQIFKGVADGKKWQGAFIVINQRPNGEFIVTDSINAPRN
jgi:hypothetical protein